MSRRTARKHTFILLFQLPFHQNLDPEESMELYFSDIPDISLEERAFIAEEYKQTVARLDVIDQKIAAYAAGWAIDRLSKTDLAVLRLAVYEMDYVSDIPVNVAISEAVALSKLYGTDDSPVFVNGVLGKMADHAEAAHA